MDFKKKTNPDAGIKGVNARLSLNGYNTIKKFCQEKDYKIGAYIEVSALAAIEKERNKELEIKKSNETA